MDGRQIGAAVCFGVAAVLGAGILIEGCQPKKLPPSVASVVAPRRVELPRRAHGPSREPVKHGLDPQASAIVMTAEPTTLAQMVALPRPDGLAGDLSTSSFQSKRVAPFETQVWRVEATIDSIILREDGDFYMVVSDATGAKSVVEVPDPAKCQGSPLEPKIATARKALEAKFHPTKQAKTVNAKATLEGVGFFGFAGVRPGGKPLTGAKNGARLMPGLGVTFK